MVLAGTILTITLLAIVNVGRTGLISTCLNCLTESATDTSKKGKCGKAYVTKSGKSSQTFYPWIVPLINDSGYEVCIGSLIRSKEDVDESDIIVTTSQCASLSPTHAILGIPLPGGHVQIKVPIVGLYPYRTWFISKRVNRVKITGTKLRAHKSIALIVLKDSVKFTDYIGPVCVPGLLDRFKENEPGLVSVTADKNPADHFEMLLHEIDISKCRDEYQDNRVKKGLCIGGAPTWTRFTYKIRQGGPFFVKGPRGYTIRAMASFGTRPTAGVFSEFKRFIRNGYLKDEIKDVSSLWPRPSVLRKTIKPIKRIAGALYTKAKRKLSKSKKAQTDNV